METQRLLCGVVDDEERSRTLVILRESDRGRVLRQVHVDDNPTHLQQEPPSQHRTKQVAQSLNTQQHAELHSQSCRGAAGDCFLVE